MFVIYSSQTQTSFWFRQALLQTERHATETAKKEHAEAERINEELVKKFEGAEKKIEQLQDTVQRYNLTKTTSYL